MNKRKNSKKTVAIDDNLQRIPEPMPIMEESSSTVAQPAQSVHMPGMFASARTSHIEPQNTDENDDQEEVADLVNRSSISMRHSPTNPFQAPLSQDLGTEGTGLQALFNSPRRTSPVLQNTPRISVPTKRKDAAAPYNSPEVTGPANFGLSVSHDDLWEEDENGGQHDEGDMGKVDMDKLAQHENDKIVLIKRLTDAAVPTLGKVTGPVEDVVDPENPKRYYYTFPSCILEHDLHGKEEEVSKMKERYNRAIGLAERYVGKQIKVDDDIHHFTRSGKIYLRHSLEILTALFSNLYQSHNVKMHCFKLDPEIYADLTTELLRLRKENDEGLVALGLAKPALPRWGRSGDVYDEYWSANDFEVLAAGYRAQIEMYLQTLLLAHKKVNGSITSNSTPGDLQINTDTRKQKGSLKETKQSVVLQAPSTEARSPREDTRGTMRSSRPYSRRSGDFHSSAFGMSAQTISSNQMRAMFGQRSTRDIAQTRGGRGGFPPDDSDDSDDSDEDKRGPDRKPGNNGRGDAKDEKLGILFIDRVVKSFKEEQTYSIPSTFIVPGDSRLYPDPCDEEDVHKLNLYAKMLEGIQEKTENKGMYIKTDIENLQDTSRRTEEHWASCEDAQPPVEGGPKTAEVH
ncbi:hypothetical protein CVT24_002263 [Panaeolus cyanescens]|uniref:Uncharacterized protein n=1 Tax=Panaeolus cyanescens TaxID=181874 RepID=A0A409WJH3_9AGAR|nr:hypothetical protein CVT24_002263 [Panaeolus cyanescens]